VLLIERLKLLQGRTRAESLVFVGETALIAGWESSVTTIYENFLDAKDPMALLLVRISGRKAVS
jgi:hypothetical protein